MISPGFTGAAIDRADHLRLKPERIAELEARPQARLLRLADLDPVLDEAGRLGWDSLDRRPEGAELIFLGLDKARPLFAPLRRLAAGQRAWSVFRLLAIMSAEDAALWGTARALVEWHNRHRFCANCGSPSELFRAGWGRSCSACAVEHFPRVDPVVIMLAEHSGRVLLGRQPQYPAGRYSALAGFMEPGESIEEAVARELKEEAGISVTNARYVASQPWPFPGSLMIGCFAEALEDHLTLDQDELEDAMWVDRAGVRGALAGEVAAPFLAPPPFAIAHTLLATWLAS
ncbi:MAG TPA: NAD(+) diphosphatase [Allosphingosinicella sp.]|jgi:NAD+ diphosphatase|uniref:NAD(+) diphosphatase n=1 Tax=Allosphingosinicella sp. TaxID=2823234 RepID=UPI002F2AE1DE